MNAKLTAALIKLAADFPDDIVAVMNATSVELYVRRLSIGSPCSLQDNVDVAALALAGFLVGYDAQDVTDVLDDNGVPVVSYY